MRKKGVLLINLGSPDSPSVPDVRGYLREFLMDERVLDAFEHPDYIKALSGSAAEFLKADHDHLLFSFHGIPQRHLRKSDPTGRHCLRAPNCCQGNSPAHATCYRAQCFKTVAAFLKQTGVTRYSVAFQSRLGREPWLTPYTDQELRWLARNGVKKLLLICPAFVADCLETIEEIGMRGRETFLEAGGRELTLLRCLNSHPLWIAALEKMVAQFCFAPMMTLTG